MEVLQADHPRPWGLVFLNRFRQLSLPVAIDIDCHRATVLHRRRCSVVYIMNIAWRRMLHNGLEYFRMTSQKCSCSFPQSATS